MASPAAELRAVFCEALDRGTAQEQAAYLDRACQGRSRPDRRNGLLIGVPESMT